MAYVITPLWQNNQNRTLHSHTLAAAVVNNPNYLVYGPAETLRVNDPGNSPDLELIAAQGRRVHNSIPRVAAKSDSVQLCTVVAHYSSRLEKNTEPCD